MRLRKDYIAVNAARFSGNEMLPTCAYCGKLGVEVMPGDHAAWNAGQTFWYTYSCPRCSGTFRITYSDADLAIVKIARCP